MSSATHYAARSMTNTSTGVSMTWWRTNFNMPVPMTWTSGSMTYGSTATSFDLSGYVPGLEICVGILHNIAADVASPGTVYVNTGWYNPSGTKLFTIFDSSFYASSPGTWSYSYDSVAAASTGCCAWEVASSGDYSIRTYITGACTHTETTTITFSNVPSTTQLATSTPGHMWVDGNYLAFVNANRYQHRILGMDVSNPGATAGHVWLETTDDIFFISENGHKRCTPWKKKQFKSEWSNSSTGTCYAGTDKVGTIWMDSEFGSTHLAVIASDGYKYLMGAGDWPY